jgi:hypothetical protein
MQAHHIKLDADNPCSNAQCKRTEATPFSLELSMRQRRHSRARSLSHERFQYAVISLVSLTFPTEPNLYH